MPGLVVGLVVGLGTGLPAGLVHGLAFGLAFGLTFGLGAGLASGLLSATGVASGKWMPDISLISPMSALRQELAAGLTTGLTAGLTAGLAAGLTFGLAVGLTAGLAVGLGILFSTSTACIRYLVGMAASMMERRLPPHLGRFLTWACDSGLLRVSGATYQFRHRELQDWLHPPDVIDKARVASSP